MVLNKLEIEPKGTLTPFKVYLLSDMKVKRLCKEFEFYKIRFYREELGKQSIVWFEYPRGNLYWFLDFEGYVTNTFLTSDTYVNEWELFLNNLKKCIKEEFLELKTLLKYNVTAKKVVSYQCKYMLRDYQASDLCQFLVKFQYWQNRGLILSEPRTGKSRVAIAAWLESRTDETSMALIICPKTAQLGWTKEFKALGISNCTVVNKISDVNSTDIVKIISYDLYKKLTLTQIRALTNKCKEITLICDEVHRLRNFQTLQSKAIYSFKDFCYRDDVDLRIIGLTGTPAVKMDSDVFGVLCLMNDSKIKFHPTYDCFDTFKEYFYYCEDTSFGKIAKSLRRDNELNFIIQSCSVQTKQCELDMFKNYTKVYKKIELNMDDDQRDIYTSVEKDMEYGTEIDCENKLVQLIRLQQICVDPSGLVAAYDHLSPKLKWITSLAIKCKYKIIVASKKVTPLKHLEEILDKYSIKYSYLYGSLSFSERNTQVETFTQDADVKVMLLQLDTGREALTLPVASAMVFLDRDFAQGYNEQAEARITPVDGKPCTKYIVDLVMKHTKEEEIYDTLVVKKKSINNINTVFMKKESDKTDE